MAMLVWSDGSGGDISVVETTDFRQSTIVNGEMPAKSEDNFGLLAVAGLFVLAMALGKH